MFLFTEFIEILGEKTTKKISFKCFQSQVCAPTSLGAVIFWRFKDINDFWRKKNLVLAHPFFVKASKYPNEAPQRPETCTKQLYKPSRMKKRTKIDTANLVLILDMKPRIWPLFFLEPCSHTKTENLKQKISPKTTWSRTLV